MLDHAGWWWIVDNGWWFMMITSGKMMVNLGWKWKYQALFALCNLSTCMENWFDPGLREQVHNRQGIIHQLVSLLHNFHNYELKDASDTVQGAETLVNLLFGRFWRSLSTSCWRRSWLLVGWCEQLGLYQPLLEPEGSNPWYLSASNFIFHEHPIISSHESYTHFR